MTKDLIPFNADQLPSVDLTTDDELKELTTGTDFLQRIQLVTKGKFVDTQKIAPGRYGVPQPGGDDILDLTEQIDILPLAVRAKALDMGDRDAIIAVYDMNLPEFDRISFNMDLFRRKELRIQNVRRQNNCVAAAIELLADGHVNLDSLVTHEFPLDETQKAFETVADYRDGVIKAMVRVYES